MEDPVVACLARRLATLAGMPRSSAELQVTAYEPRQDYKAHTDDPERPPARKRLRTIFAYLSDGLADGSCGGATLFTKLRGGLRVFPRKGEGLMWSNYTPDGKLDARTEHAGEPVTCKGLTKWGLNVWFAPRRAPSPRRGTLARRHKRERRGPPRRKKK
jgi:prolyl 4-hydroxylase